MKKLLCKWFGHQWQDNGKTDHHDLTTYYEQCVICQAQKTNFTQEKEPKRLLGFIVRLVIAVVCSLFYFHGDTDQVLIFSLTALVVVVLLYLIPWLLSELYAWIVGLIYS